MSVNSILTNSSALSALQSLNMTEQNLSITQNQVSTGLAVANASQNAAYWSVAQQLTSDSGIVSASNSALAQSQAIFDTATSAINSVITTINSIQSALTEATNPGANISNINTTLQSLAAQLTDAVNGASFNGTNILNGSLGSSPVSFVSGFDASATGGSVSTISFTAQALSGGATVASTASQPPITNATTIANLLALTDNSATVASSAASYGVDSINKTNPNGDTTGDTFSVTSVGLDKTTTVTTYTGLDQYGNVVAAVGTNALPQYSALSATQQAAGTTPYIASLGVSVTTTPYIPTAAQIAAGAVAPSPGLLTQNGINLTTLGSTGNQVAATTAATMLAAVGEALSAVTNYSATIGATQDRMTAASTFNSALATNYANGASSLVDADMNMASTRLQALQTQQQLGIQSLSIANQNSQLILKLFEG